MKEVPFCIEGNSNWNEGMLLELARSISDNVQVLSSEQRKITHIAACLPAISPIISTLYQKKFSRRME
jgi:hypothetical protein